MVALREMITVPAVCLIRLRDGSPGLGHGGEFLVRGFFLFKRFLQQGRAIVSAEVIGPCVAQCVHEEVVHALNVFREESHVFRSL